MFKTRLEITVNFGVVLPPPPPGIICAGGERITTVLSMMFFLCRSRLPFVAKEPLQIIQKKLCPPWTLPCLASAWDPENTLLHTEHLNFSECKTICLRRRLFALNFFPQVLQVASPHSRICLLPSLESFTTLPQRQLRSTGLPGLLLSSWALWLYAWIGNLDRNRVIYCVGNSDRNSIHIFWGEKPLSFRFVLLFCLSQKNIFYFIFIIIIFCE